MRATAKVEKTKPLKKLGENRRSYSLATKPVHIAAVGTTQKYTYT